MRSLKLIVISSCFTLACKATQTITPALQALNGQLSQLSESMGKTNTAPKTLSKQQIREAYKAIKKQAEEKKTFRFTVTVTKGSASWQIPSQLIKNFQEPTMHDVFDDIMNSQKKEPAQMVFADNNYIGIFSQNNSADRASSTVEASRIMVITRTPIFSIANVTDTKFEDILTRCALLAQKLGSPDEYYLETNHGAKLQGIPHLHVHVTVKHNPLLWWPMRECIKDGIWNGADFDIVARTLTMAYQDKKPKVIDDYIKK